MKIDGTLDPHDFLRQVVEIVDAGLEEADVTEMRMLRVDLAVLMDKYRKEEYDWHVERPRVKAAMLAGADYIETPFTHKQVRNIAQGWNRTDPPWRYSGRCKRGHKAVLVRI